MSGEKDSDGMTNARFREFSRETIVGKPRTIGGRDDFSATARSKSGLGVYKVGESKWNGQLVHSLNVGEKTKPLDKSKVSAATNFHQ